MHQPAQIGPYPITGVLGRGGMGVVYRGESPEGPVAIKVSLVSQSASGVRKRRFQREVGVLSRLSHPGLLGILSHGEQEGMPWFSMPLIEGQNLEERLRSVGVLPADELEDLALFLADALAAAHEAGVWHRDLKPENVLLKAEGGWVVADFGLAKDLEVEESLRLSKTGAVQGTPGFWAPEQALGRGTDERTDIYGLGATLYAAACGLPPCEGSNFLEIMVATRERAPRPLARADLSPQLEAVIMACLAKDPAERPQSMREVSILLKSELARRPRRALLLGLCFACGLVCAGVLLLAWLRAGAAPIDLASYSAWEREALAPACWGLGEASLPGPELLRARVRSLEAELEGLGPTDPARGGLEDALERARAFLGLSEARAGGAPPAGEDAPARLARALLHAERGELEAAREEAGVLLRRRVSEPLLAQARRALLLRCAADAGDLAAAADEAPLSAGLALQARARAGELLGEGLGEFPDQRRGQLARRKALDAAAAARRFGVAQPRWEEVFGAATPCWIQAFEGSGGAEQRLSTLRLLSELRPPGGFGETFRGAFRAWGDQRAGWRGSNAELSLEDLTFALEVCNALKTWDLQATLPPSLTQSCLRVFVSIRPNETPRLSTLGALTLARDPQGVLVPEDLTAHLREPVLAELRRLWGQETETLVLLETLVLHRGHSETSFSVAELERVLGTEPADLSPWMRARLKSRLATALLAGQEGEARRALLPRAYELIRTALSEIEGFDALLVRPGLTGFVSDLALELGRPEEALANGASYVAFLERRLKEVPPERRAEFLERLAAAQLKQGQVLHDLGQPEAAVVELRAALAGEIVESDEWRARSYLARSYLALERPAEAWAALSLRVSLCARDLNYTLLVLRLAASDPQRKAEAEELLAALLEQGLSHQEGGRLRPEDLPQLREEARRLGYQPD